MALIDGEGALAAADQDRHQVELVLIDQPGRDRPGCELRTSHPQVAGRGRLQLADRVGIKVSLDPRSQARRRLQCQDVLDR